MEKKILITLSCIIALIVIKRYLEIDIKMLTGKYSFYNGVTYNKEGFVDSLFLYADNTYKQIHITTGGKPLKIQAHGIITLSLRK